MDVRIGDWTRGSALPFTQERTGISGPNQGKRNMARRVDGEREAGREPPTKFPPATWSLPNSVCRSSRCGSQLYRVQPPNAGQRSQSPPVNRGGQLAMLRMVPCAAPAPLVALIFDCGGAPLPLEVNESHDKLRIA